MLPKRAPLFMAKNNQVKNEYFLWASFSSASSTWSAPKDETHGLIQPVLRAIRASAPKRKADWLSVAFMHGLAVQGGGRRLSMEADSVNKTIP